MVLGTNAACVEARHGLSGAMVRVRDDLAARYPRNLGSVTVRALYSSQTPARSYFADAVAAQMNRAAFNGARRPYRVSDYDRYGATYANAVQALAFARVDDNGTTTVVYDTDARKRRRRYGCRYAEDSVPDI